MTTTRFGAQEQTPSAELLQKLRGQYPASSIITSEDGSLAYAKTGDKKAPFICFSSSGQEIDVFRALSDKNFLSYLRSWLTEAAPSGTTYIFLNQSPTQNGLEIKVSKHLPGEAEGKPYYLELKLEHSGKGLSPTNGEIDSAINSAVIKLLESRISFSSLLRISPRAPVPDALSVAPVIMPFTFFQQESDDCPFIARSNLKGHLIDPKEVLDSPEFRELAGKWMNERGLTSATFYVDTWQDEEGKINIWTGPRNHAPERRACVLEVRDSNGDGKIDSFESTAQPTVPDKILELADQSLQGQAYGRICSFLGLDSAYSPSLSAQMNTALEKLRDSVNEAFNQVNERENELTAMDTGKFIITGIGPDGKNFIYTTSQMAAIDALERDGQIVFFIGSYDYEKKRYIIEANQPRAFHQNSYLTQFKGEMEKEIRNSPVVIQAKEQIAISQPIQPAQAYTPKALALELASEIQKRVSHYEDLLQKESFGPLDEETSSREKENLKPYIERLRHLLDQVNSLSKASSDDNGSGDNKLVQSLFEAAMGFETLDGYARATSWKLDVCSKFGGFITYMEQPKPELINGMIQDRDELLKEIDAALGSLGTLMRQLDALTINGGAEQDFLDRGNALDLLKMTRETMRNLEEARGLISKLPDDPAGAEVSATFAFSSLWSATLKFIQTEKNFNKIIGESATEQQVDRWGSDWRKFMYHTGGVIDYAVLGAPTAGAIIGGLVSDGAGAGIGRGIGQGLESAWFALRGMDGVAQCAEPGTLLSLECAQSLTMIALSFSKLPGVKNLSGVKPASGVLGYGFMGSIGYHAYMKWQDIQDRGGLVTNGDREFYISQLAFMLFGSGLSRLEPKAEIRPAGKRSTLQTKTAPRQKLSEIERFDATIRNPLSTEQEIADALGGLSKLGTPEANNRLKMVADLKSLGAASPYDYLDSKLRNLARELALKAESVGMQGILIELGEENWVREFTAKYAGLVETISNTLKESHGVKDYESLPPAEKRVMEEKFITGCIKTLEDLGIKYNEKEFEEGEFGFMSNALDSKKFNCYNYSLLVFDVAKQLGIPVEMVASPKHVSIKTGSFVYEPTSGTYADVKHIDKIYPIIFTITAKPEEIAALSYENLATSRYKQGQHTEAFRAADKAIELMPTLAEPYVTRGNLCFFINFYEEAIADYTKAIELNPKYARAYRHRGMAYEKMGEQAKAEADFKKAKELERKELAQPPSQAPSKKAEAPSPEKTNVKLTERPAVPDEKSEILGTMALEDMLSYRSENARFRKVVTEAEIESAVEDVVPFISQGGDPRYLIDAYLENARDFNSFKDFTSYFADSNLPPAATVCFGKLTAVLKELNGGEPYDLRAQPLVRFTGQHPVYFATIGGKDVIIKFSDCREDIFALRVLEASGIQETYSVSQYGDDFALIELLPGYKLEHVLAKRVIPAENGKLVELTPELMQEISRELGKQMAAHYAFSIADWHSPNFIVRMENGKIKITRIDFEDYGSKEPNIYSFKKEFPGIDFDQAQFDQGFTEAWNNIRTNSVRLIELYRNGFDEVVSIQSKTGTKDARTKEHAVADVKKKLGMSTEEALRDFKVDEKGS